MTDANHKTRDAVAFEINQVDIKLNDGVLYYNSSSVWVYNDALWYLAGEGAYLDRRLVPNTRAKVGYW